MLLYVLATCCIVSIAGFNVRDNDYIMLQSDYEELQWPEMYTVKATRVVLTSGLVEDYTAWKTNASSRVDYNQGAVKVITNLEGTDFVKHAVHPETTEEILNKIVCYVPKATWGVLSPLDSILPTISKNELYEEIGNETMDEITTIKFEYIDKNHDMEVRNTIWAYYEDEIGWIPVRYEVKNYIVRFGSLYSHDIWTFFDFNVNFEINVFDIVQFGCVKRALTPDSDKIVKELLFINPENEKHVDHVFNHFQNRFERYYAHEREHALRRTIFAENMRMVASVNRQNRGYKLSINQFSDRTPQEMAKSKGAIPRPEGMVGTIDFPYEESKLEDVVSELPKNYDMRLLGLISPVKNQETCGSCWTFAAAAVTESALAKKNGGKVLSLSSQAIADCAYEYLDGGRSGGGCNGGHDFAAYEWIMIHGLPTEEEYGPYKNRDDFCHIANVTKTYKITGYTDVTKYSNNAMKVALVNHGALFINLYTSYQFDAYSSGIFSQTKSECRTDRPDHTVTLVGYGERDGDEFWIIKNSWGETWGMNGYMLVSAKDNVCGIISSPSYPVI